MIPRQLRRKASKHLLTEEDHICYSESLMSQLTMTSPRDERQVVATQQVLGSLHVDVSHLCEYCRDMGVRIGQLSKLRTTMKFRKGRDLVETAPCCALCKVIVKNHSWLGSWSNDVQLYFMTRFYPGMGVHTLDISEGNVPQRGG
jgi:hypothetical protein